MTSYIEIRSAEAKDLEQMREIYAPYITDSPVSFEMEVPSIEEFGARMDKIQEKLPWIVAVEGNKVLGYAYASDHRSRYAYRWTKELSVYVHPDARGKKLGTRLYDELIERLKTLEVNMVLAGITLSQKESIAFHEKYGFKLVGVYHSIGYKFNQWHDVGWWELNIGDDFTPDV